MCDLLQTRTLEELVFMQRIETDICLFIQLRTAACKAYCAIWIRRSNFRHQASQRVSPRESTKRRKVEL